MYIDTLMVNKIVALETIVHQTIFCGLKKFRIETPLKELTYTSVTM